MDIKRSLNCFLDPQLPPIGPSLLKIICSSASKRDRSNYLPSIWPEYLHNLKAAKNGYMEKRCVFFRRWSRNLEMDTWRSGRFWFYCIRIFALKCQKLRTPLASLAPCVTKFLKNLNRAPKKKQQSFPKKSGVSQNQNKQTNMG